MTTNGDRRGNQRTAMVLHGQGGHGDRYGHGMPDPVPGFAAPSCVLIAPA